jgi:hypothetical protein
MSTEHKAADQARRLLSGLPLGARTQRRVEHAARQQCVSDRMRTTMDVTIRSQDVHCESDHQ